MVGVVVVVVVSVEVPFAESDEPPQPAAKAAIARTAAAPIPAIVDLFMWSTSWENQALGSGHACGARTALHLGEKRGNPDLDQA